MKIAVVVATGMVGSRVAAVAVARGHEVTGISRRGGEVPGAESHHRRPRRRGDGARGRGGE